MTPVQGIIEMGLFLRKARVTAVTGSVALLTHGLTCTLPPILSDPLDALEEVFGLSQKTGRDKQRRLCLFFFFFFLSRAKTKHGGGLERNLLLSRA